MVLFCVQMDSLMRNDWPDTDTGIRTAFRFAMPEGANEMIVVSLLRPCKALATPAAQRPTLRHQARVLWPSQGITFPYTSLSWNCGPQVQAAGGISE